MSGFYASKSTGTSGGGGGGGVTTLNSLTGALTLAGADGVTITDNGTNTITVRGVPGFTFDDTIGAYRFAPNEIPDTYWFDGSVLLLGGGNKYIWIGSDAGTAGQAGCPINIAAGDTASGGAGGYLTLSAGFNLETGVQAKVHLQGSVVSVEGGPLQFPTMTTTQRDAIPVDASYYGSMIFNTTVDALQVYVFNGGSPTWKTVTVS